VLTWILTKVLCDNFVCFCLFKTIRLTQDQLKSVTFLEVSLCADSTGKLTENINEIKVLFLTVLIILYYIVESRVQETCLEVVIFAIPLR